MLADKPLCSPAHRAHIELCAYVERTLRVKRRRGDAIEDAVPVRAPCGVTARREAGRPLDNPYHRDVRRAQERTATRPRPKKKRRS